MATSNFSTSEIQKHIRGLESQGLSGKALENRIHADAQKHGVTSGQLEQAQGWGGGTVANWTKQNNKTALLGGHGKSVSEYNPAQSNYGSGEIKSHIQALGQGANGYLDHEMQIYRDAAQRGLSESQLEQAQGWAPGTVRGWTSRYGLDPLTGRQEEQSIQQPGMNGAPQTGFHRGMKSQNQLHDMLASDSPLMRQAETMGLQRASARGLLNSSMASQAAQGAMIDKAAPFALQDARTRFQHEHNNTDRQQQEYMSRLGYQQQLGLGQQQHGFDMNRLQASSAANAWGVQANNVTDIVAQGMEGIANIQANPNITPENKTSMIEQILEMRDSDIQFQGDLYESLSSYLADTGLFPNL